MRPEPASENLLDVLRQIVAGEDPYFGSVDPENFGGRTDTLHRLKMQGYLDEHNRPTEAGRAKVA